MGLNDLLDFGGGLGIPLGAIEHLRKALGTNGVPLVTIERHWVALIHHWVITCGHWVLLVLRNHRAEHCIL